VLSGGEKSRLALVKLLLDPPNLLLMDEPTTHLDLASVDALVRALEPYEGTLIFISHDVYFIRKLARLVLHVEAGNLTLYHGDYDYYLHKRAAESVPAQAETVPPPPPASASARERKRQEAEARQARSRRRKIVNEIEASIAELENRQKELVAILEDPDTYKDAGKAVAANRELHDLSQNLARLNAEWELAAQSLDENP
jgi:ATP-binding cassette subfamily F protein 3